MGDKDAKVMKVTAKAYFVKLFPNLWSISHFTVMMLRGDQGVINEPTVFDTGGGTINYGEFLMHMNTMEKEERLIVAFKYFVKDGSGYIAINGLRRYYDSVSI